MARRFRLRWPGGFLCPCCGHREHCELAGRGLYQCNRCKKQTSPTAGTIFHATAADTLVRRHPPDRDGEERHLVGGTRPPSRGQAADGLGREAQDHGGDGAARGGDGAYGAGRDGRRLSRRGALRRQAGPRRGGQNALRGGGLDQSRGAPAQAEAGAGQGLLQARDRARRQALAGPRRGGCDGRPGLLERTRRSRLQPSGDPHRVGPTGGPHAHRSNG